MLDLSKTYVGQRVIITPVSPTSEMPAGTLGTVTEVVLAQGGCLVFPDGWTSSYGFGWGELEAAPPPPPPKSVWYWIRNPLL